MSLDFRAEPVPLVKSGVPDVALGPKSPQVLEGQFPSRLSAYNHDVRPFVPSPILIGCFVSVQAVMKDRVHHLPERIFRIEQILDPAKMIPKLRPI